MRKILLLLLVVGLLGGCGSKAKESSNPSVDTTKTEDQNETIAPETKVDGYSFLYEDIKIPMNVDAKEIISRLGESHQYFEAESCAFKGLDKTYSYSGFELTTYPYNETTDYVSSVYFLDDSVNTEEGIYIGSTVEELLEIYGDDYEGGGNSYTYTKGESAIQFLVMNDEITAITYLALVDGLDEE